MKPLEWELSLVFRNEVETRAFVKKLMDAHCIFTFQVTTGYDTSDYYRVDIEMSWVTNLKDVVRLLEEEGL